MAKKKKAETVSELEDTLANDIINAINSNFSKSKYKTAYHLTDPEAISDISGWISTGCSMLDLAISNRPHGGLPIGRITEITGMEASGKSLLAAHALADTQRQGGLAVYIDTEAAVSREFLEAIGIDVDTMLYIPLETLEDIFETIELIITKVRASNKDKIVTIVTDSVMGATTRTELAGEYEKQGWNTDKSIILSMAMRKITNMIAAQKICLIFTNQLRTNLGVTFGEKFSTSGGKALAFHSSVRLRLAGQGQIKIDDSVVGIKTKAIVKKNRLGPPLRTVIYDIYFSSGIDNYGAWLTFLKDLGEVKTGGAWYTLTLDKEMDIIKNPETAEVVSLSEIKFLAKNFPSLLEMNPNLKEYIYDKICEKYIMKYKINKDFSIDDVTITDDFEGEES